VARAGPYPAQRAGWRHSESGSGTAINALAIGFVDGDISCYRYLWMCRFPLVDAAVGELKVHFIGVQEEKHLHSWLSRLLHPFLPAFAFQFGPSLSGSVTNTFSSGCAHLSTFPNGRGSLDGGSLGVRVLHTTIEQSANLRHLFVDLLQFGLVADKGHFQN
jgi:hypothetical protein